MQEKKIETQVVENSVDLDYLNAQKASILAQKEQQKQVYESQMIARDKEIEEIDEMIAECRKAGLKTLEEVAEEKRQAEIADEIVDENQN